MPNWLSNISRQFLPPRPDPQLFMSDADGYTGAGALSDLDPLNQGGSSPDSAPSPAPANLPPRIGSPALPPRPGTADASGLFRSMAGQSDSSLPPSSLPPPNPLIQQVGERAMNPPALPPRPSLTRQIFGGLAGLNPIGRQFEPLIEYGPRGLQQIREYQQYQSQLPEQIKAGQLVSEDESRREAAANRVAVQGLTAAQRQETERAHLATELQNQIENYDKVTNDWQDKQGAELHNAGEALPANWGTRQIANPRTGQLETWRIPSKAELEKIKESGKRANDVALPPDVAKTFGLDPATKVDPVHVPAYLQAYTAKQTAQNKTLPEQVAERTVIADALKLQGRDRETYIATGIIHPPKDLSAAADRRSDQSYHSSIRELDSLGKPIQDATQRVAKLRDTLAQNSPQADALIAPELLTVMAGGQGSGLRMNEAEISRIIGGRSNWETLKASINKWQLDPKAAVSITRAQRQQIHALVQTVSDRITEQNKAIDDAYTALTGTDDPAQHRKIVNAARQRVSGVLRSGQDQTTPDQSGKIRVRRKSDGATGTLDPKDFDASKYEKL